MFSIRTDKLTVVGNRHESHVQCEYCKVHLCISSERNCFKSITPLQTSLHETKCPYFLNLYFVMKHAQYLIVYAQFSVINFLYFMVVHALYFINTYHLKFTSTLLITGLL